MDRYNNYSSYFKSVFGSRVQKVAVNAGFTCPNRDGFVGVGGCTFCLNEAFTPSYCTTTKSVAQQIEEGIEFHRSRYARATKYLAYFQSFSNTYKPVEQLEDIYNQALTHADVVGLVIGTRPDCVDEQKLDMIASIAARGYHITIEYGIESVYNETLKAINRGHDFATAAKAVKMTAERGLHCGAHFIVGLPGENRQMILDSVQKINALPLQSVKFHQLQLFKDTAMAEQYEANAADFSFFTLAEYIDLFVDMLELMRPDIYIERFAGEAPPRYHAFAHPWGLVRNERLVQLLQSRLEVRQTFQGRLFVK